MMSLITPWIGNKWRGWSLGSSFCVVKVYISQIKPLYFEVITTQICFIKFDLCEAFGGILGSTRALPFIGVLWGARTWNKTLLNFIVNPDQLWVLREVTGQWGRCGCGWSGDGGWNVVYKVMLWWDGAWGWCLTSPRVALHHLVVGLEASIGDLSDGQLLVVSLKMSLCFSGNNCVRELVKVSVRERGIFKELKRINLV